MVFAQHKQLLYDFNEIPQSLMLNPGMEADFQWYAGVPLLSGIYGMAGSNNLSINDIFADDGLDINLKIRERALTVLGPRDEFSAAAQVEYLSAGFRGADPRLFYTFGGYVELNNVVYWPEDYADLIWDGNAGQLNRRYDLSDLNASGSLVNVMHFGINKKVDRKLTVGARAKLYSGIADYRSVGNRGFFVNRQGENNALASTLDADLKLRTSGIQVLDTANDEETLPGTFMKRAFFGGDLGLGVDVGFSYHLNERTTVTGSLLDVGFIYHSNDTKTYTLEGRTTVEGIEIDVLEQFTNLNRDFWQDLVDEVETAVPFETNTKAYLSIRPIQLYGSIRHNFGAPNTGSGRVACDCTAGTTGLNRTGYRNSVGAQLYAINRPKGPQAALTGFYTRRVGNVLALKTTYTIDKFSLTNIGLGLNLQAGPIHIYMLADNLLSYRNLAASNYGSFQLGVNIISWGRK